MAAKASHNRGSKKRAAGLDSALKELTGPTRLRLPEPTHTGETADSIVTLCGRPRTPAYLEVPASEGVTCIQCLQAIASLYYTGSARNLADAIANRERADRLESERDGFKTALENREAEIADCQARLGRYGVESEPEQGSCKVVDRIDALARDRDALETECIAWSKFATEVAEILEIGVTPDTRTSVLVVLRERAAQWDALWPKDSPSAGERDLSESLSARPRTEDPWELLREIDEAIELNVGSIPAGSRAENLLRRARAVLRPCLSLLSRSIRAHIIEDLGPASASARPSGQPDVDAAHERAVLERAEEATKAGERLAVELANGASLHIELGAPPAEALAAAERAPGGVRPRAEDRPCPIDERTLQQWRSFGTASDPDKRMIAWLTEEMRFTQAQLLPRAPSIATTVLYDPRPIGPGADKFSTYGSRPPAPAGGITPDPEHVIALWIHLAANGDKNAEAKLDGLRQKLTAAPATAARLAALTGSDTPSALPLRIGTADHVGEAAYIGDVRALARVVDELVQREVERAAEKGATR